MNTPTKLLSSRLPVAGVWLPRVRTILVLALVLCSTAAEAVERVSIRPDGTQGNAPSSGPATSEFAHCVAFYSDATNLLPNRQDTNAVTDVFLSDRRESPPTLLRVSVASDGTQANRASQAQGFRPSIDADCSCVAFSSDATNLVDGDTNRVTDVFLRELAAPATHRLSVGSGGEGNGASSFPSVNGDCTQIAFHSTASNLVGDDTNNTSDIFVHTRASGEIQRVSLGAEGQANGASITPSISADGNCVAFASAATNLLAGDTNGIVDIYVSCGGVVTCRASVDSNGNQANGPSFLPSLNADGTIVAFKSLASNLVPGDLNDAADVFVHSCITGETERVSIGNIGQQGNDHSFPPTISDDGRFVAFGSFATNLILGQSTTYAQIYVRDRREETTTLISRNLTGGPANGSSPDLPASVSPDGTFVAFASLATNLVVNDTNMVMDAFVNAKACVDDDDCPDNGMCVNGMCEPPECRENDDCPPGQVCAPDGTCQVPTPTATPTPEVTPTPAMCEDNTDCPPDSDCCPPANTCCPPGHVCISGACVTPRPTCMADEDCEVACDDNPDNGDECAVLATPPPRSCVDGLCEPADRCRSQRCVPPRPCEDFTDCFGTEACLEDVCECGGDCNLDGVIFGSEISTALNVLVGVAPLSVCPAADINGDGSVMGTEINLALSNLAQGCPDLLTPLSGLGQSRAGDVVTFNVGSASGGPGETVNLSVGVRGGMGEMVMAQLDLLYDPTVLTVADAASACRLDGRLGRHVLRTSNPETPAAPVGRARLRIFVGDLTLPVDAFGEGALVSCAFQIAGGAAGGTAAVLADHLNVSDANANSFGTEAAAGAVEIVAPIPVPPTEAPTEAPSEVPTSAPEPEATATSVPAPPTEDSGECTASADCGSDRRQACIDNQCVCAGDCNGDGDALVSELVAAVNVVLGQSALDTCAAADVSGDGVVSVDELLVGLGNVTRGCPAP